MKSPRNQPFIPYIMNLLTTLTCLLIILNVFLLSSVGFDLYEWNESYQSWVYLYCIFYALVVALIIAAIAAKLSISQRAQAILYFVAGFVAFLPLTGFSVFTFIAGTAAAIVAGVFFICYQVIKRYHKKAWPLILLLPVLLALSTLDYTEKREWQEQTSEHSFSAQFAHFNGTHEIPIILARGDTANTTIHFSPENKGGYAYSILNENNQEVSYHLIDGNDQEMNTAHFYFNAEETGIYRVIVTGFDLQGTIEVNWEVE